MTYTYFTDLKKVIQYVSEALQLKIQYIEADTVRNVCKRKARPTSGDSTDQYDCLLRQISSMIPCIVVIEGLDDVLEILSFSGAEETEAFGAYSEFASDLRMLCNSIDEIRHKSISKDCQIIITGLTASVSQMNVHIRAIFHQVITLKTVSELIKSVSCDELFTMQAEEGFLDTTMFHSEIRITDTAAKEAILDSARAKSLYLYEFLALRDEILFAALKRECFEPVASECCRTLFDETNVDCVLDSALHAFETLDFHEEFIIHGPIASKSVNVTHDELTDCFRNIEVSYDDTTSTIKNLISFCPSSSAYCKRMSSRNKASRVFESNISPVRWTDIGGMETVRQEIMDIFYLPSQHPNLFTKDVPRRRSMLLYGPPGTGKTYVARAVATECQMHFISVKGPELLDMYVGESEKNVREVFSFARTCAPSVIFFDELDSLAPARGRGKSGAGVMDRIVSQILAEIDSLGKEDKEVFIIGATNRPDLLDPALLRPGRFDRKIFVTVCTDIYSKEAVLKAQTKSYSLKEDVDLLQVAEALPAKVSGADIAGICRQAYTSALTNAINSLARLALSEANSEDFSVPEHFNIEDADICDAVSSYMQRIPDKDLIVRVTQDDFLCACRAAKPSISDEELLTYEAMGSRFDDAKHCIATTITADTDDGYSLLEKLPGQLQMLM